MESISISEIFLIIGGVGFFVMTVIASMVLLYIISLIRSAKRIAQSLEGGIEFMKHDLGAVRGILAGKSGVAAAMVYKFVEGYLSERKATTKKRATRKKATSKNATSRKQA